MGKVLAIFVGLVLLLLVVAAALSVGSYNSLVTLDEGVDAAWSQVENVYQRRADLIPNLVETVKGAAEFEQDTFVAVTEARAGVGKIEFSGAPTPEQLEAFKQAQGKLTSALSRLLVVVERYPDLKATQNFRDLQVQLEGTENRITVERRNFNEAARNFNTKRRTFPTVLLANMFGFGEKAYFESSEGADEAPTVDFSTDG